MSWLQILGIVVMVVMIAAVFGIRPRGGRPAASTRLMTAARVVLVMIVLLVLAAIFWGR